MKLFILGQRKADKDEVVEVERCEKETEKLYFEHIFPYFRWNDLLRFRRVCKDAKELADKYIKTKGEKLCPEITIYETGTNREKCLTRFLKLGFPATSIYIMNTSGSSMFQKEAKNFAKLAEKSGPGSKITQVRIHQLSDFPIVGKERAFFEGLSNLKVLLVDHMGRGAHSEEEALQRAGEVTACWPERFKQLKKVTIGVHPDIVQINVLFGSRSIMEYCLELEYSADAFSSATGYTIANENPHIALGITFKMIKKYIEERGKKYPTKANLQFYDFDCYHKCPFTQVKEAEFYNSLSFLELLKSCVKHSVKLLNVNSAWLQRWSTILPESGGMTARFPDEFRDGVDNVISAAVVSMVNLHGLVIPMEMRNLERLTIPATSRCSLVQNIWRQDRNPWPSLKVLDVTVDSKMLYSTVVSLDVRIGRFTCMDPPDTTASLFEFLFVGIQREAVTEVSLAFVEGVDVGDVTLKAATNLGICCPNMRKLTLVNWPGTNATVIKVLGDVKALEELCLDNCKKIGDRAFIKTDKTHGLIQQHPGLKKLSLKQLDKMPKLSDKLFQDVLSRMKLSHLLLSSNMPLTNITPDGISALKNGEFAKSIEQFPFTGWSLANVSKKRFKKMEKEFRAHDMI